MPQDFISQTLDLDGQSIPISDLHPLDQNDLQIALEVTPDDEEEKEILQQEGELSGQVSFEVDEDNSVEEEFSLTLPAVPGGENQDDLTLEEEEDELEVQDVEVEEVDTDPWKWKLENFTAWLSKMMQGVPRHSGEDTSGILRAVAYLKAIDAEIDKAARTDLRGVLDVGMLEKAKQEIHKGIKRLEERLHILNYNLYGKKKKAELEIPQNGFVKEAFTAAFQINVPIFMSAICRILINSTISGGHDMEETFKKLDKKFKFTDREKLEIVQVLMDMNFPLRRDRGIMMGEEWDPTSSDNFDFAAGYMS